MNATVASLHIYRDSDSPGQELSSVHMTEHGPAGNRSKKHAVHLVAADDYVVTYPKANVVLDMAPGVLEGLVGRTVRLGGCTLEVTRTPSQCAGVYAEVVHPGHVAVGDALLVAEDK
jgi:hypothetical protein